MRVADSLEAECGARSRHRHPGLRVAVALGMQHQNVAHRAIERRGNAGAGAELDHGAGQPVSSSGFPALRSWCMEVVISGGQPSKNGMRCSA